MRSPPPETVSEREVKNTGSTYPYSREASMGVETPKSSFQLGSELVNVSLLTLSQGIVSTQSMVFYYING